MGIPSISARLKIWAAVGLALTSLLLAIVGSSPEDRQRNPEVLQQLDFHTLQAYLDAGIDSLLMSHDAQIETSRKRTVPQETSVDEAPESDGLELSLVEREVVVSKSFSTLDFNRQLSNLGARYGIRISARENTKRRSTLMDLRYGEATVERIRFIRAQ